MKKQDYPILEYYPDDTVNLFMFFSNGKKEFWRFDKVKQLGIDKCVMFFPRDFKKLKKIYSKCELIYEFKSASSISPVYLYDNKVLIALAPLGGPASANLMEELIFVGIKYFIGVGSCGAIVNLNIDLDQYVIPMRAIRDEGTSYHYLPASRYIDTDKQLAKLLAETLTDNNENHICGTIWSTDAIYKETPSRIAARVADGALGVEMETASLCAVAQAKGVHFANLLYYSDYNNGQLWQTRIYNKYELREELVKYAIEAILKAK